MLHGPGGAYGVPGLLPPPPVAVSSNNARNYRTPHLNASYMMIHCGSSGHLEFHCRLRAIESTSELDIRYRRDDGL